MKTLLFIFGTRPEAIKLAPLIQEFRKDKRFKIKVCVTAQHREMLDDVLSFFKIKADYDLDLMKKGQTLFNLTSEALTGLGEIIKATDPFMVFIQGDTTTALTGALAGYYQKIKVAHVEAGLRSFNKYSPFPEEINRILAGHIADIHFAPGKQAVENLKNENIKKNVFKVGNTVIDALFLGIKLIRQNEKKYKEYFKFLNFNKKIILVTGHRRESFGRGFNNICLALKEIARKYKDSVEIVYPVHLNPNVQKPAKKILAGIKNIHLIGPLNYPSLLFLMGKSFFILTDSGGIQEEAPCLGRPVLVLREVTEREEGIRAGVAKLIGTDKQRIVQAAESLLKDPKIYKKMSKVINLYGDGKTSKRIKDIIVKVYLNN